MLRDVEAVLRSVCSTEPLVATKDGLLVCVVPQETDLRASWPEQPSQSAWPPTPALTLPTLRPASDTDADTDAPPARTGARPSAPPVRRGRRRAEAVAGDDAGFAPLRGSDPALPAPGVAASDAAPVALRAVSERLGREPDLRWRVGVSRARTGVAGVRIGFEEARGAVELAGRLASRAA